MAKRPPRLPTRFVLASPRQRQAPAILAHKPHRRLPADLDAWLARARGGDKAAMELIFAWLRTEMRGQAQAIVHEQRPAGMDASDLAQGALERLLAHLSEAINGNGAALHGYAYKVLYNHVMQTYRFANRKRRSSRDTVPLDAFEAALSASGPRPSQALSGKQDQQRFLGQLLLLPDDQRTALFYHYKGRSMADIAATLGRTEKGVSSLLARVVRRVRAGVATVDAEPEDAKVQAAFLRYLHQVERGVPVDGLAFVKEHPAVATELQALLEGLDWLQEQLRLAEGSQ